MSGFPFRILRGFEINAVPYLTFPGTCEEALALYARVLGGEVSIMRCGDMPPNADMPICRYADMPISDAWKDKVMHASLSLGNGSVLYFSDIFEDGSVTPGDNIHLVLP